jgi:cobalt-zinc-cadmium efflux system protein
VRHRRLLAALAVSLVVSAGEIYGGYRAQSLGLVADALHAGTDALAIGITLLASYVALRPANRRKTFGYGRVEVLGAVFNGSLLLCITGIIAYNAVLRFEHPTHPQGATMAIVSAFALCGNLLAGFLLMQGARLSLNTRSAFLHVSGDAMGSFAVMVGGLLIAWTHLALIDPALSLLVCAIVVGGVAHMLREALDVLLEAVPRGVDLGDMERTILGVPGVLALHELHVWTIGAGAHALSAHVPLARDADAEEALRTVQALLRDRFDVTHVTLQLERAEPSGGEALCIDAEKPPA